MKTIYMKEMKSYFHSLSAYLFFALFLAASGIFLFYVCLMGIRIMRR